LIEFTPALRAQAEEIVKNFKIGPIFTPPVVNRAGGPLATLLVAGGAGTANWPGGSFDPETGIMYVSSQAVAYAFSVTPGGAGSDLTYITRHGPAGASVRPTVQGLPLIKPPYGQISAIDLNSGDILWQVPHGETPDYIRNHPALTGITIPRTGRPGQASQLVTRTLVVAGEKGAFTLPDGRVGAMLRAYDKSSGREVGAVYMPAPQTGGPMTYMLGGRQYIVVAVGSERHGAEFIAFRVPTN
jgi:quinoprotein glucose dehydrogenase